MTPLFTQLTPPARLQRLAAGDGDGAVVDEGVVDVVAADDAAAARMVMPLPMVSVTGLLPLSPWPYSFVVRVAAERHRAAAGQRLAAALEVQHPVGAAAGRPRLAAPLRVRPPVT